MKEKYLCTFHNFDTQINTIYVSTNRSAANSATLVDLATPVPKPDPPVASSVVTVPTSQPSRIEPLTGITFDVTQFKPSKMSIQLCEDNGLR